MMLSGVVLSFIAAAPAPQEGYRLPPRAVVDIVDAPPPPRARLSPDGRWMLLLERDAMPSIADLSRRMLRLAGMRIDPVARGRYQTLYYRALHVRAVGEEDAVRVPIPDGAAIASASWSHDSSRFVFTVVTERGSELWAGAPARPAGARLLTKALNAVMGGVTWLPDGEHLIAFEIPPDQGEEPPEPSVPTGPNVRETAGRTTPLRTYQDLLRNPHDEALFEHYATSRMVLFSLEEDARRVIGGPAIYSGVSVSPDGMHLLVTRLHGPWSYVMPFYRFPQTIEVWSLDGEREHVVAEVPLQESIPIEGVRTGPRSVAWKAREAATIVWAEALDGGDPNNEVDHRDKWMRHAAPFGDEPEEILRVGERAWGLSFLGDPDRVISREYDRDRRWIRSLLHDLSAPDGEPVVIEDRSIRDRYGDPGRIVQTYDEQGSRVARQDGDWVYRSGSGASPKGLLPFLDRQNLETLETERIWRCEEGAYESVVDVLGMADGELAFVTSHEEPTSPPNYRIRHGDDFTAITEFPDPTPQIRGLKKQLVTYQREDGVDLSATLYLPADYVEGTRLPLLVWAYPIEFNDPATAGQVSSSPWRFTRIWGPSHLALLTQGYAVMDAATMPVIGDPETMNDTFVEQIVMAAEAAIRKADELGVADPNRAAVGGHSYGAFMTANLLAHSDLFRTGIARSGAYNRTLTPFGFQSERRTVWEAPEIYFAVSPFFHADGINEPILLIHGEIDNNSGTFPMQSERLYQAIKGNGGTARLVMLPNESHGYRSRESVLHVLAETIEWLDEHVKATN